MRKRRVYMRKLYESIIIGKIKPAFSIMRLGLLYTYSDQIIIKIVLIWPFNEVQITKYIKKSDIS